MGFPTAQRNWTIVPNVRVTGSDMTGSTQNSLYLVKQLLVLSGSWTIKGTGANGTGAMDAVDRWASPSNILAGSANGATQGPWSPTGVLGDMAWACLTSPSGSDLLLAWFGNGATDTVRFSYSVGGLFVASNYHVSGGVSPTASDECHFGNTPAAHVGFIGGNTTGDRIFNFWIDSTRRSFRFAVIRSGSWTGLRWGVEDVDSVVPSGSVTWSGSWGFCDTVTIATANYFSTYNLSNQQIGGQTACSFGGVFKQTQLVRGMEAFNASYINWQNTLTTAQSSEGYPVWRMGIAGLTTTTPTGKFGNLVDWWLGRGGTGNIATGDVYGSSGIIVDTVAGFIWPWNTTTATLF